MMTIFSRRAVKPLLVRAGALAALTLPLAACDGLLEVEDIDKVTPTDLQGEGGVTLRLAGALSDFTFGFSGSDSQDGLVPAGGLFTDELLMVETFPTRREIDLRRINNLSNGEILDPYRFMHRARIQASELTTLATEVDAAGSPRIALGQNLEAYSEVLLGEHFCSGVPFSTPQGNEIVEGEPLTTKQIFERSLPRFDAAIAAISAVPDSIRTPAQTAQRNLARVGKGRALLNLGRYADAAAAVANVPANFAYYIEHSDNTTSQRNSVFALQENARLSVSNNEGTGGNTLAYRDSAGGRIPNQRNGVGFDGVSPLFFQGLYDTPGADVPLASGLEARLIGIEAMLNRGQSDAYLAPLNALRASFFNPALGVTQSLPALSDPGTAEGRVRQFFRERAFFLYLTGHRLGDLRRLIRFYGFSQEQVFPTGTWHKQNRTYGTQTSFPIPFQEENNTKFTECLPTEGF